MVDNGNGANVTIVLTKTRLTLPELTQVFYIRSIRYRRLLIVTLHAQFALLMARLLERFAL